MATSFEDRLGRTPTDNRTAMERPEEFVRQIIDDVEQTSVALQLGDVRRMASYQMRLRLANTKPNVKWINGTTSAGDAPFGSDNDDDTNQVAKDSGLKQTTKQEYATLTMTPDEIAIQVVMPDAWRDDSDMAWELVRKDLRSSFSQAIDAAVLWGRSLTSHPLPSTFGDGVIPDTIAAGHIVVEGDGVDLADDYALTFQEFEQRGFTADAAVIDGSDTWRLRRLRSGGPEGLPIYQTLPERGGSSIYGRRLAEVQNGTWLPTHATALVGDFSNLIIGIKQDITFEMSRHASIHDADGNVVYNAWEQDGEILRAVMRLGYVVTDPYKYRTGQREWPFQVMAPENYSS